MPAHAKYTAEMIADALNRHEGVIWRAAKELGCSRRTIERRASENDDVKEVIRSWREALVDEAERKLWDAVQEGAPWAVCFTLKTQGKARGYVEKQQVENVTEAQPIELKLKVIEGVKP
jgi:hypothetical protein